MYADLLSIKEGIICQQVNCQSVMGAGLAKAICEKYPKVKKAYLAVFLNSSKESLFGKYQLVRVTPDLSIANIFSQFRYGNPLKTGLRYTDYDKLIGALDRICKANPNTFVYVPHNIGCGLGGGRWGELEPMIKALNHKNLIIVERPELIEEKYNYEEISI